MPKREPADVRFWRKVVKSEGCWLWAGHTNPDGYGRFWNGERNIPAHCWSFEDSGLVIPAGLTLDHLCHTLDPTCLGGRTCPHRPCVRPSHLEPVTNRTNVRRGKAGRHMLAKAALITACPQGHEYTPENTFLDNRNGRECRTCRNDRKRAARAKGAMW